jgi:nicotinamide mononucleotide transporter
VALNANDIEPLRSVLAAAAASSALEWLSLLAGVAYALLAVRRNRWCWAFGAVSSAILAWLAFHGRLPMQAALQACYVGMAFWGFWQWSRGGDGDALAISTWPLRVHALSGVGIVVIALLLAPLVEQWTAAAWPRIDTATMLASLLATAMVAIAKLENWLYWIVIDAVSIFLYGAQQLWLPALLYLLYLCIAISGYFAWRRRWAAQGSA